MKSTLRITVVATTILLGSHIASAQTNNSPTEPSTPTQSELSPGTSLFVIKRFSITTSDGGLQGISPGKKVTFIREEMGDYIITDGSNEGRAPKSSFTNDQEAAQTVRVNTEKQEQILAGKNAEAAANVARIKAEIKDNEEAIRISLCLHVKVHSVKGKLIFGDRDGVGLFHARPEFERLRSSAIEADREKAKRYGTFPEESQTIVIKDYPKVNEIAEGEAIDIAAVRIENYTDGYSTYMQYRYLREYNSHTDLNFK